MAEIVFSYNGKETKIKCKPEEKMKEILERYTKQIKIDINKIYFMYNEKKIDENLNFNELAEEEDKKSNIMKILVNHKKESIIKSEEIICPICKKLIFIEASNYKLIFHGYNCEHKIRNILLKDYERTQNIKISCECKEENKDINQDNKDNQEFWICLKCNKNLCPKCKDIHGKENENEHKIIKYNLKNCFCNNHYEKYSKCCLQCKKNLCKECKDHEKHSIIEYEKINYHNQELKGSLNKLRVEIDKIKKKLDNIIENLEIYYKLNENLYNNKYREYKNYEALMNISLKMKKKLKTVL